MSMLQLVRDPSQAAPVGEATRQSAAIRLLGKASWGLADQLLISATNFATMVLLARGLGPAGFGAFVLVYTSVQFANSLQSALIIQPHSVLGATREGADYVRFTASSGVAQLVLASLLALVAAGSAIVADSIGWPMATLLFAAAPTLVAWQLQEFVRRVLYTELRLASAFANDLVSYGGQTVMIAWLWWFDLLTAPTGMYAIGATSAVAAAAGVWQLRGSLFGPWDRSVFHESWRFGKWLVGAEIGYWLSSQMYIYLTGIMLGASAAGIMKAGYVIFGPARILGFFLRTVLPTWFARTLAAAGKQAVHAKLKLVYSLAVPILGAYSLLAAVFAGPLLRLLYGDQYDQHVTVVVLYAVFALVAFMASVVAAALRARRQTRVIFATQLGAVLTLPAGWLLIEMFGINGAVLGMILTSLVVNLSYWRVYRQDLGSPEQSGGELLASSPRYSELAPDVASDVSEPSTAGGLLVRLVDVLDREGIPYCLLHGYEQFPERVESDVDCVISADHFRTRLPSLFRDCRRQLDIGIVQWLRDDAHFIVLSFKAARAELGFLQLHAGDRYDLCRRTLYRADEILESRRRFKQFWVPAAGIEFACYLARRIVKERLDDDQQRRLGDLYRQDPDGCRRELSRLWGAASSELIIAAAASADWSQVVARLGSFRAELLRCAAWRRPLHLAANLLAGIGRVLRRRLQRDRGLSVAFLGIDGSGKSSVLAAIRRQLAPAFASTERHTFPPALRQLGGGQTNSSPHAVTPRSWPASVVRAIAYWFTYYTVGYYFCTRQTLARQVLILYDRHLVDALADARRYRYGGPRWLLELIWTLTPKPDLLILLDAPVEVARARKQEVPAAEAERQRTAYRALIGELHNGHVVDASQPLEQVIVDAREILLTHLEARTARQLCLEANA